MKCTLKNELTIARAAEIRTDLLQALAEGGTFELDTRQVTEVDAAGLQILLAALKSALGARAPIRFSEDMRGPAVSAGLRLLGLAERSWGDEDVNHGKEDSGR
jgi:anti-sigma B factor antagonist